MPRATWVQTNFNGGEWSPLTWGRFDLAKYKNGLAECTNYLPMQQGGLTRRPGTPYVATAKDNSYFPRLQRFEFSITQAYIIEFGNLYLRIYTNDGQLQTSGVAAYNGGTAYVIGDLVTNGGVTYYCIAPTTGHAPPNSTYWYAQTGTIYEIPTPYVTADLWGMNFAQSADTLYIAHASHPPMKLQRAGATRWTLSTISFIDGPYQSINVTSTTLTPSGTTGTVNVVASAVTGINGGVGFRASDVGRLLRIKCGAVWLWGFIASYIDTLNITWTITDPTHDQVPVTATATANLSAGSVFSITITNGGSGYGAAPPNVTISGGGGAGAVAYATLSNGVVVAITVAVTGTGYGAGTTVTVAAPAGLVAASTAFWRMGEWNSTDGYPTCVIFHQDRLVWAGAASYPGRVDASNTGDYENMAPTNIDGLVVDSNALAFTLSSGNINGIYWMVSDEYGMLIGTAGGEWVIAPSSNQQAITPTNVNAKPLSNYGSSSVAPVRVGKATLFVQRTQRKLRELFFQYYYNTFQAQDISLVAEHLTASGLKQMALQLAPQQIVWIVRNNGTLTGMTYDKDQDVCGWHKHPIGGFSDAAQTLPPVVGSVATIPAPNIQRDEVWIAVQRYINGATVYTIERMAKLWEDGDVAADGMFLDSSATYSGAPTTTISGLTWLKGQTVGVLGDGSVHPDCVVSNSGVITLQRAVSKAQVGLRYTSRAKTLHIEAGGADGPSQGKLKRIFKVILRFFQTVGLNLGTDDPSGTSYPLPFRSSADPMDQPVALFSGDMRQTYEGSWKMDGQMSFETSDPLPNNITLLVAMLDTQDAS